MPEKNVLFNAVKVWKYGFVKSKKVWNQIKIWTLTSLVYWLILFIYEL